MVVETCTLDLEAEAHRGIVNITRKIQEFVSESGMKSGIAVIFNIGSTGAITTMEYEPGLMKDIPRVLERMAPGEDRYEHHLTWGDDNGSAHVKAAMLGPSLTVPFTGGKLSLGTWQQIVVINFDTRARRRRVVVQIMGE
ncbi:MAG TPA: YjbQ family protein [Euryarchaeota archaeon]|nr:hypothetical protein BMS3Bbin15_01770 [archaeon BMS3Bbin15]HDL16078.1 YjbQ family protein [Euryarchaeota archaeon]